MCSDTRYRRPVKGGKPQRCISVNFQAEAVSRPVWNKAALSVLHCDRFFQLREELSVAKFSRLSVYRHAATQKTVLPRRIVILQAARSKPEMTLPRDLLEKRQKISVGFRFSYTMSHPLPIPAPSIRGYPVNVNREDL
ncbi:MAG TPA: hypothetical protein VF798_05310 [Burkholderiaceae bacterium]